MARRSVPENLNPKWAALTVALSFFIGVMSLFVCVMAFAVAGRQDTPNGSAGLDWSNSTAAAVSYITGSVAILNSLLALSRARLNLPVTIVCVVVFVATTMLANLMFVRAW